MPEQQISVEVMRIREMEQIENRMVVDSQWEFLEKQEPEVLKESGYHKYGKAIFVPDKEAYEYALDQCLYGAEEEQAEFKKMLVEWYYSGNDWRREG